MGLSARPQIRSHLSLDNLEQMEASFLPCILVIFASVEGFDVQQACPQVCPEPPPCQLPPGASGPPPPPQPQPEVICNCLQVCPEPFPPPCTSYQPLLLHQHHQLHQQQKREAEEGIGSEPASPDSGLTESITSTDADNTERDPNANLFNGVGPYPPGLPYPPSTFAQPAPF